MKILMLVLFVISMAADADARSFWSHAAPKEPKADAPGAAAEIDEPYMPDDDNIMDKLPYKEPPEPFELDVREPEPLIKEPDPLLLEPDIRGPIFNCPKGLECN